MQKKDADKVNKRKYCDYEHNEKECPYYAKSQYCNLCKWGLYEGSCICYKNTD